MEEEKEKSDGEEKAESPPIVRNKISRRNSLQYFRLLSKTSGYSKELNTVDGYGYFEETWLNYVKTCDLICPHGSPKVLKLRM